MIAVAPFPVSRTSMIVSERAPEPPSTLSLGRRSEPRIMSVCGSPGSVCARPFSFSDGLWSSASTTLSTSWNAATVVAPAEAKITSAAPMRSFFQRPGRGISSNMG